MKLETFKKVKSILILIFIGLFVACSITNPYAKMSEEEMVRLAKADLLYSRISKIIWIDGQEVSKEEAINRYTSDYYGERFIEPATDSIVVKVRKVRRSDLKLKQKIGFYLSYGNYADTITTRMDIDCTKVDSLLSVAYNKDQENRSDYNNFKTETDAKNQQVLFSIIEQCGFPNSVANNKKSIEAAWLILLHSDVQFQKKYFGEIKKAVKRGDLSSIQFAYFEDKLRINNDKKQRYGTQRSYNDVGNDVLSPVDNITKVNKRRKKIGLPPVELK